MYRALEESFISVTWSWGFLSLWVSLLSQLICLTTIICLVLSVTNSLLLATLACFRHHSFRVKCLRFNVLHDINCNHDMHKFTLSAWIKILVRLQKCRSICCLLTQSGSLEVVTFTISDFCAFMIRSSCAYFILKRKCRNRSRWWSSWLKSQIWVCSALIIAEYVILGYYVFLQFALLV